MLDKKNKRDKERGQTKERVDEKNLKVNDDDLEILRIYNFFFIIIDIFGKKYYS